MDISPELKNHYKFDYPPSSNGIGCEIQTSMWVSWKVSMRVRILLFHFSGFLNSFLHRVFLSSV